MRRVYLDLGAAWGDTLDLHRQLVAASANHRDARDWEVFSFEADPKLATYVDKLCAWKNGRGREPPTPCEPPVGSTKDQMRFAEAAGCALAREQLGALIYANLSSEES